MKQERLRILLTILFSVLLTACDRPRANPLASASQQLSDQFLAQHAAKKVSPPRKLLSARITGFEAPPGNPHPYLSIAVAWEDATTNTGVPLIQLGDGLFGLTYKDPTTKEEYSAVINFR